MRAPSLHIDFAPGARRIPALAMGLVLTGGALLAVGLYQGAQLLALQAQAQAGIRDLETRRSADAAIPAPAKADARQVALLRATRQVSTNLATPWSRLLTSLGSTSGKEVALLSIEPSVAKQSVRLTAEARDATQMLDYLSALQHDARLSSVVLVSHQLQVQAPGTPVRFQVQAQWGDAP
jgi:Tfp pilus assembly protein PilN